MVVEADQRPEADVGGIQVDDDDLPDEWVLGAQDGYRNRVADACDAIALCSFTETFSLAAMEAMALGRPVVHSDVGGASEMIVSGCNGFLFPVGDTGALVDKLAILADRAIPPRGIPRYAEFVIALRPQTPGPQCT